MQNRTSDWFSAPGGTVTVEPAKAYAAEMTRAADGAVHR